MLGDQVTHVLGRLVGRGALVAAVLALPAGVVAPAAAGAATPLDQRTVEVVTARGALRAEPGAGGTLERLEVALPAPIMRRVRPDGTTVGVRLVAGEEYAGAVHDARAADGGGTLAAVDVHSTVIGTTYVARPGLAALRFPGVSDDHDELVRVVGPGDQLPGYDARVVPDGSGGAWLGYRVYGRTEPGAIHLPSGAVVPFATPSSGSTALVHVRADGTLAATVSWAATLLGTPGAVAPAPRGDGGVLVPVSTSGTSLAGVDLAPGRWLVSIGPDGTAPVARPVGAVVDMAPLPGGGAVVLLTDAVEWRALDGSLVRRVPIDRAEPSAEDRGSVAVTPSGGATVWLSSSGGVTVGSGDDARSVPGPSFPVIGFTALGRPMWWADATRPPGDVAVVDGDVLLSDEHALVRVGGTAAGHCTADLAVAGDVDDPTLVLGSDEQATVTFEVTNRGGCTTTTQAVALTGTLAITAEHGELSAWTPEDLGWRDPRKRTTSWLVPPLGPGATARARAVLGPARRVGPTEVSARLQGRDDDPTDDHASVAVETVADTPCPADLRVEASGPTAPITMADGAFAPLTFTVTNTSASCPAPAASVMIDAPRRLGPDGGRLALEDLAASGGALVATAGGASWSLPMMAPGASATASAQLALDGYGGALTGAVELRTTALLVPPDGGESDVGTATTTVLPGPPGLLVGALTTSGDPLAGAVVMAFRRPEGTRSGAPFELAAWTSADADGRFALALDDGIYAIRVRDLQGRAGSRWLGDGLAEGRRGANAWRVANGRTTDVGGVDLPGRSTGAVVGTVRDDRGAPVPGAWVLAFTRHGWARSTVAGPDGRFSLTDLGDGPYVLASHPLAPGTGLRWHTCPLRQLGTGCAGVDPAGGRLELDLVNDTAGP